MIMLKSVGRGDAYNSPFKYMSQITINCFFSRCIESSSVSALTSRFDFRAAMNRPLFVENKLLRILWNGDGHLNSNAILCWDFDR